MKKKESDLQIQCVEYLTILATKHKSLCFFSIPNEGLMTALISFGVPEKVRYRIVNFFKKMGLLSGVPDFQILYNNKCIFIEFKSKNHKPNERQLNVHKKINCAGFDVFVIDDYDRFLDLLLIELGL